MEDSVDPMSFLELIALIFWGVATLGPCILYFKNDMNLSDNDRELLDTKIVLVEDKVSHLDTSVSIIENLMIDRKIDKALNGVDLKSEVLGSRVSLVENQIEMIKQVDSLNFFDSLLIINSLFLWSLTIYLIIFCSFYYNKKIQIIIS
jgi:hypothetical protein